MQRNADDYNSKNDIEDIGTIHGRISKIEILRLDEIHNVIDYLIVPSSSSTDSTSTTISALLQIGVQGDPGLLMCINGEEIRIGRSGLYEILNGYKITFIGFIINTEPEDDRYFILDYQYERREPHIDE